MRQNPGDVFRAGGTGPDLPPGIHMPIFSVGVGTIPLSLEDWAKVFIPRLRQFDRDIKVLSDKPSRLKDGAPAREVEIELVPKYTAARGTLTDAPKLIHYYLLTKRDLAWVWIGLVEEKAKFREDLKKHAYSLAFLPGREDPVTVPPDVRAFLDMDCADSVSRDVANIMAHYSDRFLHSGMNKTFYEQVFRLHSETLPGTGVTALEAIVTVFEPRGDRAYVAGFYLEKTKDGTNALKAPMEFQHIIKEQGQWKWYGNQK